MQVFRGKNQWGIVLGGSSGLGLASAKILAKNGLNLIVVHRNRRSDMTEVNEQFEQIRKFDVELETFNIDAVNPIKMKAVIDTIKDLSAHIKIKVLLHSIAKGNLKPINTENNTLSTDDFSLTIGSMGISLYQWAKAILDESLFEHDARILSFTSEGSHRVWPNYAAVSAAKASLESISRSLALELAPYNIKSNCIQPGTTKTKAFELIPDHESLEKHAIVRNPYNRLTTPQDVAKVVYLMTLDEASWINGTIIPVNGGEHLQ